MKINLIPMDFRDYNVGDVIRLFAWGAGKSPEIGKMYPVYRQNISEVRLDLRIGQGEEGVVKVTDMTTSFSMPAGPISCDNYYLVMAEIIKKN
jgi:hypothetical protein